MNKLIIGMLVLVVLLSGCKCKSEYLVEDLNEGFIDCLPKNGTPNTCYECCKNLRQQAFIGCQWLDHTFCFERCMLYYR